MSAIPAATAIVVAWLVARALAGGWGPRILDHPNERSLHECPTPRTGGLAIVAGLVVGSLLSVTLGLAVLMPAAVLAAVGLVLAVSLLDDAHGISPLIRILVQVVAAALLVDAGLVLEVVSLANWQLTLTSAITVVVSGLAIVWLVNLYNFMDGVDGLAAGMGLIGFAAMATLAWRAGDNSFAARSVVVAGACAGFLAVNFPPARLFMGDSGSSLLGLLVATTALEADARGVIPFWLSLLVFSPFVVDATVTLVRRTVRGEAVWSAHRSHFYQRLVLLGWGHRRTVLHEYLIMLGCALTAIGVQGASHRLQLAALCGWALVYAVLIFSITRMERAGGA